MGRSKGQRVRSLEVWLEGYFNYSDPLILDIRKSYIEKHEDNTIYSRKMY